MFICDVRGGCVAVYKEPARQCLSYPLKAFVFYRGGKQHPSKLYWTMDKRDIWLAEQITKLLNTHYRIGRVIAWILFHP